VYPLYNRRNFEAPNTLKNHLFAAPIAISERSYAVLRLRASNCTIGFLGYRFAKFNLFVPSLLQHIEAFTVAHHIQETMLRNVPFCGSTHFVTAISAPSAGMATNY
jgi:hypothetical protein